MKMWRACYFFAVTSLILSVSASVYHLPGVADTGASEVEIATGRLRSAYNASDAVLLFLVGGLLRRESERRGS